MKRFILYLILCFFGRIFAATGDITVSVNADGWSALLVVEGFTTGATYDFDYNADYTPGANTPYMDVVSQGYDATGTLGTITRRVYLGTNVNVPYSTATQPGGTWSGTFVDGETITCSTSGATAVIVGNQSAGSVLRFRTLVGTPLISQTWTGGTSGATFVNSSSTVTTLTLPAKDELNNGTSLITRVSLSDYVYLDDNTGVGKSGTAPVVTIPAGFIINSGGGSQSSNALSAAVVTNNSTQDYPGTRGRFVTLPYKLLNGNFTVEWQAFNRHAINGKPVAATVITFDDGTVTRTQTITAMSLSTDDDLPVYAASDDATNFTQGANITARLQIYPWVGDADNVLDSSSAVWQATGMALSNLPVGLCDKNSTYGVTYAAVSSTGNDTSGVASNVAAIAEATPCLTIAGAYAKIAAYNNTNYGRNTVDAGQILLIGGGFLFGRGGSTYTHSSVACTITRSSGTTKANATIVGPNLTSRYPSSICRLYDLTVAPANNTDQLIGFTNDAAPVIVEDVTVTGASGSNKMFSANTNGKAAAMWKNVQMSGYTNGMSGGNDCLALLIRGCSITDAVSTSFHGSRCTTGSILVNGAGPFTGMISTSGWTETGNVIISYNRAYNHSDLFFQNGSTPVTGYVFVGNLDERVGANVSPSYELSTVAITDVLFWHNTSAGQRVNTEGDVVSAPYVNASYTLNSFKYNSWYFNGTHNPGDVYVTDGAITGQWPYSQYDVGWAGNNGEQNPDTTLANFPGIGSTVATTAGYTTDASIQGTNLGNGNYTPTSSSILRNKVRSGEAVIAYDMNGLAIPNNGTGSAGAFQFPVTNSGAAAWWWIP